MAVRGGDTGARGSEKEAESGSGSSGTRGTFDTSNELWTWANAWLAHSWPRRTSSDSAEGQGKIQMARKASVRKGTREGRGGGGRRAGEFGRK